VGGTAQYFPLRAYVQTTTTFGDTIFSNDVTFSNAMPYLFMDNAIIGEGATATIESGSQLLFARHKGLQVNGMLKVNGSAENPVLFAAARYHDDWYANKNAQWEGIVIANASAGNILEYAIINGANTAFTIMDTFQTTINKQLTLRKCTVSYINQHICIKGGSVTIDSSVFSNKLKNETITVPADSNKCI
jgi:hypothetical protein